MMPSYVAIAILGLLFVSGTLGDPACLQSNQYCSFDSQHGQIVCAMPDDLSKVNLACSDLNNEQVGIVLIVLKSPVILDSKLDLSKIDYGFQILAVAQTIGFEIANNPLLTINQKNAQYYFFNASFEFYLNGKKLEEKDCTFENYGASIFSKFAGVNFYQNYYFPTPLCPYAFNGLNVAQVVFQGLSSSNLLSFVEPADDPEKLAVRFQMAAFKASTLDLDTSVLSPYVYGNTQTLIFDNCTINSIADDTFMNLANLNQLWFLGLDLAGMAKKDELAWLQHVNEAITVKEFDKDIFGKKPVFLRLTGNKYTVPDEDFCLYKDFPHQKLVVPVITDMPSTPTCNCALMFLIFQGRLVRQQFTKIMTYKCLNDGNFYTNLLACDFDAKIAQCESQSGAGRSARKVRAAETTAAGATTTASATTMSANVTTAASSSNMTTAASGNATASSNMTTTTPEGEMTTTVPEGETTPEETTTVEATTEVTTEAPAARLNYKEYITAMQQAECGNNPCPSSGSGSGGSSGASPVPSRAPEKFLLFFSALIFFFRVF